MKKIFVIDSYPDLKHPFLKNKNIECYKFDEWKNEWEILESDKCYKIDSPHGTATGGIIAKNISSENVKIHFFDIYSEHNEKILEKLKSSLEYIDRNFSDGLINCSLGSVLYDSELEEITRKISKKILIVAAFDNAGGISYPAAFNSSIGVDTSFRCVKKDDFVVVRNSEVDIKGKGGVQRVPWVNPNFTINQGSSFACAYVVAYIANHVYGVGKEEVLNFMENKARFIYNFNNKKENSKMLNCQNKRVAVVPSNKEVQTVCNFLDSSAMNFVGFYDYNFSGNVGKKIEKFMYEDRRTVTIEDIKNLNYQKIDYLLIGHIEELSNYYGRNLKVELLERCLKENISAICLDSLFLDDYYEKFKQESLHLIASDEMYPSAPFNFGKLATFRTPILGIFGTTSKQGKFTLQLHLKKILEKEGYKVGGVGTEPTSFLFGFDYTYPFGYLGIEGKSTSEIIEDSNNLVRLVDNKEQDIILIGSQSGTVPQEFLNQGHMTTSQLGFLLGTKPDSVILRVNFDDELEYIDRTIKVIENIVDCKVIALSIYPFYFSDGWGVISNRKTKANKLELEDKKIVLMNRFNLPVIELERKDDDKKTIKIIEKFFSEGEYE